MAVRGSVKARVELREVITQLELTAPEKLKKDLLAGTREASKGIKPDVQRELVAKLPKRHGYGALVAKSTKVLSRVTGGAKIRAAISVTASGKREKRDLPALNRGLLKHMLFGNRRHWYVQRVRPGAVDDPIDRYRDRVVDNARKAANEYADTIARG